MRFMFFPKCMVLLIIYGFSPVAQAAGPEAHWTQVLAKRYRTPERVMLKAGGKEFTALYLPETSGEPKGGIILLHGRHVHADWPAVIGPLRRRLPAYGWSTLSLQLPVLDRGGTLNAHAPLFTETGRRVQAGIDYLRQKKMRYIVLLGYELGATMAVGVAAGKGLKIDALVLVSLLPVGAAKPDKATDSDALLAAIRLPVLDLYAYSDLPAVLGAAHRRRRLVRSKSRQRPAAVYRQIEFDGADHEYRGHEARLSKRIHSWLKARLLRASEQKH